MKDNEKNNVKHQAVTKHSKNEMEVEKIKYSMKKRKSDIKLSQNIAEIKRKDKQSDI